MTLEPVDNTTKRRGRAPVPRVSDFMVRPYRQPGQPRSGLTLITRSMLDRRSLAGRKYDRLLAQIYRDLGAGSRGENLTAVQRTSAEAFCGVAMLVEALHVRALSGEVINPKVHSSLLAAMTKLGSKLGLGKPVAKSEPVKTTSLADYLAGKASTSSADDDEAGHDD